MEKAGKFIVLAVYIVLAVVKLDSLPGEWYGDISNVHEYTEQILAGKWPVGFFQSEGPVYPYLAATIRRFIPGKYFDYKIISVLAGGLGVMGIMAVTQEIMDKRGGVWAGILAAGSFWILVYARCGNLQIIMLALLSWAVWAGEKGYLVPATGLASLGWATYPAAYVFPMVLLVWLTIRGGFKQGLKTAGWLVIWGIVIIYPIRRSQNVSVNYVTDKVPQITVWKKWSTYTTLVKNVLKNGEMFWNRGDQGFRTNVPGTPHIDQVTALFLIAGTMMVMKKDKKLASLIWFSILILLLPASSPALPLAEIPNNGRTLAVVVWVYVLAGYGIKAVEHKYGLRPAILIAGIILSLNMNKYFIIYPRTLPNHNVPFGRIVADYIDGLPPETKVVLSDCCWGEGGQPEPKAIYYQLTYKGGREDIVTRYPFPKECADIPAQRPLLLILNPKKINLENCLGEKTLINKEVGGEKVFTAWYFN